MGPMWQGGEFWSIESLNLATAENVKMEKKKKKEREKIEKNGMEEWN